MKYAAEMASGGMIYIKFHENRFRHSEVAGGGRTHTEQGYLISLIINERK
jgi:hypothetical protein